LAGTNHTPGQFAIIGNTEWPSLDAAGGMLMIWQCFISHQLIFILNETAGKLDSELNVYWPLRCRWKASVTVKLARPFNLRYCAIAIGDEVQWNIKVYHWQSIESVGQAFLFILDFLFMTPLERPIQFDMSPKSDVSSFLTRHGPIQLASPRQLCYRHRTDIPRRRVADEFSRSAAQEVNT
jgi:hypothetical protein